MALDFDEDGAAAARSNEKSCGGHLTWAWSVTAIEPLLLSVLQQKRVVRNGKEVRNATMMIDHELLMLKSRHVAQDSAREYSVSTLREAAYASLPRCQSVFDEQSTSGHLRGSPTRPIVCTARQRSGASRGGDEARAAGAWVN